MTKSVVVLDTNVFVAAGFNPQSSSAQIINDDNLVANRDQADVFIVRPDEFFQRMS